MVATRLLIVQQRFPIRRLTNACTKDNCILKKSALPFPPGVVLLRSFFGGGGGVAVTPFAAERVLRRPSISGPKS